MNYILPKNVKSPKSARNGRVMKNNDIFGLMIDGGYEGAPSVTVAEFEDQAGVRNQVGIRRNGNNSMNESEIAGWPNAFGRNPEWLLFECEDLDLLIDGLTKIKSELNNKGVKTHR